jgi:hypothetical protein
MNTDPVAATAPGHRKRSGIAEILRGRNRLGASTPTITPSLTCPRSFGPPQAWMGYSNVRDLPQDRRTSPSLNLDGQLLAATSPGRGWVTNGCRARKLPVASAILIRWDLSHVWTALLWQVQTEILQSWSVRPCVRPVGAARVTAGHNAFREDGARSKTRARGAWARLGFPLFRYRPAFALHHVRPSQL